MSKFLKALSAGACLLGTVSFSHAMDPAAGKTVYKKCAACHAVGDGAANKVGPQLNDIFGRAAGSVDGFKYSKAMMNSGIVWEEENLAEYLAAPRKFLKGTRMAFAGLKKEEDIANVLAYLKTFDPDVADESALTTPEVDDDGQASTKIASAETDEVAPAIADLEAAMSKGLFGLGRQATPSEVAAWDVKVMPDGRGLPVGSGSVFDGEELFVEQCAACHGDFAEGVDNWPKLAGGEGTLADEDPLKTVGSYWPYLSTVWDYVHRSMPFGYAGTLSDDDTYAIVAYILYSNDIVDDEFVLSNENFLDVEMPNADGFIVDDRPETEYGQWRTDPCMENCKGSVEITMRATVLDVTPEESQ
ncbi:MAG: c-type cytochrome [Pseudomonadota bacterium]